MFLSEGSTWILASCSFHCRIFNILGLCPPNVLSPLPAQSLWQPETHTFSNTFRRAVSIACCLRNMALAVASGMGRTGTHGYLPPGSYQSSPLSSPAAGKVDKCQEEPPQCIGERMPLGVWFSWPWTITPGSRNCWVFLVSVHPYDNGTRLRMGHLIAATWNKQQSLAFVVCDSSTCVAASSTLHFILT